LGYCGASIIACEVNEFKYFNGRVSSLSLPTLELSATTTMEGIQSRNPLKPITRQELMSHEIDFVSIITVAIAFWIYNFAIPFFGLRLFLLFICHSSSYFLNFLAHVFL
jgi:hypothetical protein